MTMTTQKCPQVIRIFPPEKKIRIQPRLKTRLKMVRTKKMSPRRKTLQGNLQIHNQLNMRVRR